MAVKDHTDEALAKAVQSGDKDAFGVLVERYEAKLLRYGRKFLSDREDIKDIVQDVFISSYKNMKSFDADQKFSPWIYRIAHNAFVNGLRSKLRNPLLIFDFDTLIAHPVYEDPAENEAEQREIKEMIDKGLEMLGPKYREVLILHYLEGLSYQEISDVLRVPISTIGVRIKRGKDALKVACEKLSKTHGTQ